ncbi:MULTISPECIES: glutamate ABC transporter substrate-binding protein [Corynebacterium]|nr:MULTISPECIES: glutamate ABC transporter substrate-binding protein [Corynebacterium]
MTMTQNRRLTLAAATMAGLMGLTACTQQPDQLPHWPEPTVTADTDLPMGAVVESLEDTDSHERPTDPTPFGSISPDGRLPEQRVGEIYHRGRIIVGVAQSLNRLGFRNPATGDLDGFEVELAREIARDIFGDPTKVEFRFVDSLDRVKALNEGNVDIVMRTMTITRHRQAEVEFSTPYLHVKNRLLVLEDSDINSFTDLRTKRVCVARNSTSADLIREYGPRELMRTNTWTDCLMAMQRHQTDAIFTDDAILSGLQAQDPYTRLIRESTSESDYGVGIASSRKGRETTGLVMQVNATLQRIRTDGTWTRLYNTWLADYLGASQIPRGSYRTEIEDTELQEFRKHHGYNGGESS